MKNSKSLDNVTILPNNYYNRVPGGAQNGINHRIPASQTPEFSHESVIIDDGRFIYHDIPDSRLVQRTKLSHPKTSEKSKPLNPNIVARPAFYANNPNGDILCYNSNGQLVRIPTQGQTIYVAPQINQAKNNPNPLNEIDPNVIEQQKFKAHQINANPSSAKVNSKSVIQTQGAHFQSASVISNKVTPNILFTPTVQPTINPSFIQIPTANISPTQFFTPNNPNPLFMNIPTYVVNQPPQVSEK